MIRESAEGDFKTVNPFYDLVKSREAVSFIGINPLILVRNIIIFMTLFAVCLNQAKAQSGDPTPTPTPTPTVTPTLTPTPCSESSFEEDKDRDGSVACGQDFCDRDPQKQEPGECGCQYYDTSSESCADPREASVRFCQFIANATRKKTAGNKTIRTMRLGWRAQPSLQGKVEYRCQVFQVTNSSVRPVKIGKESVLRRTVDNGYTEPMGDNSPIRQPTPVPALFEIRAVESSRTNTCDSKPVSQLITSSKLRNSCRCVKSVPEAGLWCHDLKIPNPSEGEHYRVQCRLRGKEPGLENIFSSYSPSGPLYVGMGKVDCQ
jgi:hypothetical protein